MSGYRYGYDLSPARPSGWRSVLRGFVTVAAVVAVSAASGALVTLELVSPQTLHAKVPRTVATGPVVPVLPAPERTDVTASTAARPPADDANQQVAAPPAAPAPQPQIAAAPQAVSAARAEAQPAATVVESDLTFAKGYAQRRAVQASVEEATVRTASAHVAADTQLGRPAVGRRLTYARGSGADGRRVAASRGAGPRPEPFDFRRDRALAYGDQYQSRRPNGGQQGGMFGNLFGGGGNLF